MSDSHYIKAGWLVDGDGGRIQEKTLLTVERGRFSRIERLEDSDAPDAARVTDLSHCTILPPFIDSHVHLCMSGQIDTLLRKYQLSAGFEEQHARISAQLHHHFSHGVLAVRDGGDRHGYTLRYKNEISGRSRLPVILKTAGRAWHRKGRYGGWAGRHPEENETLAAAFAKENEPIDHVKLINSGLNSLSVFSKETLPQFDLKEFGLIAKGKPAHFIAAQATPSMLFGKLFYPQKIYINRLPWDPTFSKDLPPHPVL